MGNLCSLIAFLSYTPSRVCHNSPYIVLAFTTARSSAIICVPSRRPGTLTPAFSLLILEPLVEMEEFGTALLSTYQNRVTGFRGPVHLAPEIQVMILRHLDISDRRFIREEESWRRMLISQPGIKKLGIHTRYVDFPTLDYCDKSVQTCGSGLRMEDYYTNIRKLPVDDWNLTLSVSRDVDERDKQDFIDKGDIDDYFPDHWAESIGYIFDSGAEGMIRKIYSS